MAAAPPAQSPGAETRATATTESQLTPQQAVARGIITQTLFAQESVKVLTSYDFTLDSETLITLKYKECILVLFYGNNKESDDLAKVWAVAAEQVAGPVFAACNLMVERRVATAFTHLQTTNSGLHWAAMKGLPFILVYQNGWPVAFYNGERSVGALIDYALTLACNAGYHEPINLYAGMQPNQNVEIKGIADYRTPRTNSLQYVTNQPIRNYDRNAGVVVVGSPAAAAQAAPGAQAAVETPAAQAVPLNPTPTQTPIPGIPTPQLATPVQLAVPTVAGGVPGVQTFPTAAPGVQTEATAAGT